MVNDFTIFKTSWNRNDSTTNSVQFHWNKNFEFERNRIKLKIQMKLNISRW